MIALVVVRGCIYYILLCAFLCTKNINPTVCFSADPGCAAALHRCLLLSIARRLAQEFALCSPRLRDSLLEKLLLLADDGRLLRFRLGCACPTFFRYPANLVTCGLQLGLCFAQTCCTALTLLPHDHRTVASGREQLLRSREFFDEILVQLLAVC